MPASQLQQEIDRALKRVDHCILEFSTCWKHLKADAASQDTHSEHEKLKKMSDDLQQHLPQLRSLSAKGGVRKAQKEKLEAARVSIDHQLDNFHSIEQKLKERELAANGGSIQLNSNADDSKGGKVEASGATSEVSLADKDAKVQWDQVLRETADDCEMVEEFICKICQVHVVGCEPKLARCSHLFCGDCITKWFEVQPRSLSWAQRAQSGGRVPCPVCKEPLHPQRDLFLVCPTGQNESALLWRLLSGVKIACANSAKCRSDGKCTWTGEYGSYQKHIQTCKNVSLDIEVLPVLSQTAPVAKLGTSCCLQQHNSIHPCDKSEDKHEHDVPSGWEERDGQEVQPAPTQITAAATTDSSGLTDLIQQLMDESSETTSDIGAKSDLASRTPQPDQQQPVEQSKPKQVCRAAHSFIANGHSQLEIKAGECIEVLNEHPSGWTYGRKASEAPGSVPEEGLKGWFPNWVVALK